MSIESPTLSKFPNGYPGSSIPRMQWLLGSGITEASSSSIVSSGSAYANYCSIESSNDKPKSPGDLRTLKEISFVKPPRVIADTNANALPQSVCTCIDNIVGLYGLEVWHYEGSSGQLVNVPINTSKDEELGRRNDGLLMKRMPQEADPDSLHYNSEARDAYERLTDCCRLDYLSAEPTQPGIGLAGTLWSEVSSSGALAAVQQGVNTIRTTIRHIKDGSQTTEDQIDESIVWREVDTLAEDPDQPYDERLIAFAKSGLTLAAAVPFDIRGFRGIVVLLGNPHLEQRKLRNFANSQLMHFAAQFIGAGVAVRAPIEKAKAMRKRLPHDNWKRLKTKITAVVRFGKPTRVLRRFRSHSAGSPIMRKSGSFVFGMRKASSFALSMKREQSFKMLREATFRLSNDIKNSVVSSVVETQYAAKSRSMRWWTKVQGGNAAVPPPFNYIQSLWTFLGVIITHSLLAQLDRLVTNQSRGGVALVVAPLGALTTLQYNLTAAPASQPRNAILSQLFALSVVYVLQSIPDLDARDRSVLAPAIVITGMAKLGITHPPAGASAILFASGHSTPEQMGIFLIGVCLTITTAVVINNFSDKRQYPTSWPILREINATMQPPGFNK